MTTRISLVVPLRDEESSLAALLESIEHQTRPPDEVVLVDGGSVDRTLALARTLCKSDPRYRIVEAGPATPGRGRNVGIEIAAFEWIALTDGGIVLEPDWLAELEAAASLAPSASVVWGTFEPQINTFIDSCAVLAYVPPRHPSPEGCIRGPFIASCLLRRSVWRAAGGFPDLRAAEDLIFIERLGQADVHTALAPRAVALWSLPPTLGATFRRFRTYSKWNVLANRQRDWHHAIARMYVGALAVVIASLTLDTRFGAIVPAAAGARIARTVTRRRCEWPLRWMLTPARVLGVALLLATIDVATFVGWVDALLERPGPASFPGRARTRVSTVDTDGIGIQYGIPPALEHQQG